jgi:hypothetical protein
MMTVCPSGTAKTAFPHRITDVKAQLVESNCISTQTCPLDRGLLELAQFNVSLPRLQDWDLWLNIIDQATFIREPRVLVTQHLQSEGMTLGDESRLYVGSSILTGQSA